METWVGAVILALQFAVIIAIWVMLIRQARRRIRASGLHYTELHWWAIAVSVAIILTDGCANPFEPDDPIDAHVTAQVRDGKT